MLMKKKSERVVVGCNCYAGTLEPRQSPRVPYGTEPQPWVQCRSQATCSSCKRIAAAIGTGEPMNAFANAGRRGKLRCDTVGRSLAWKAIFLTGDWREVIVTGISSLVRMTVYHFVGKEAR